MPAIEARMRQLIGTTADWAADDIVIGDGEIAVERIGDGSARIKIGNGVDAFSALAYYGSSGSFGVGAAWSAPSRAYSTDYTAPDHPIMVNHISVCAANDGNTSIIVGGVTVASGSNGGNGAMTYTLSAIVPPGVTYRITQSNLSSGIWMELR